MPFGLDDILLLLASASPLLWAKRGEVVSCGVYKAVSLATHDEAHARQRAEAVARLYATPRALLRGVDAAAAAPLVASSVAGEIAGEVVRECPRVPHRHFHPVRSRRPPVSALLHYATEDVAAAVAKYSVAEVSHLFDMMERDGGWEAALTVTEGIRTGGHYAYLIRRNIEAAIRGLLMDGESQRAVEYSLCYATEVLLSDDVLVALFDACRYSAKKSMALYESVKPFRAEWTPAVYACCLTVNARFNWCEALKLYEECMAQPTELRFGGLLRGSGDPTATRLQYLYHTILPLVADRQPGQLRHYYEQMLRHDPHAAVDVLLRCLHTETGQRLAESWLNEKTPTTNVISLANKLYRRKPNPMNLNSLLKVIMTQQQDQVMDSDSELQQHLRDVSLTDNDASVLARTVTDHCGQWRLAAHFMTAMIARRQFNVIPVLSAHVARQGKWAMASKVLSIHLSNRAPVTVADMSLCVESSVFAGRWKSALFWMERAHTHGVVLPTATYDSALGVTKHCSWVAALRAVVSMHEAGGLSTEKGVLDVIESAAAQGKVGRALQAIAATGNVYWTL